MNQQQLLQRMTARDRNIWELARRAVNEMGFACQMAEQGAENAQMRHEDASSKAMRDLFDLLTAEPLAPR